MGILPMIQPFKARAALGQPTFLSAPRDMDFRTARSSSFPVFRCARIQGAATSVCFGFYTKHERVP